MLDDGPEVIRSKQVRLVWRDQQQTACVTHTGLPASRTLPPRATTPLPRRRYSNIASK